MYTFNFQALAAFLATMTMANGHMIMANPKPYGNPDNSPLTSNNYPCKVTSDPKTFYSTSGLGSTWPQGSTQTLSFSGSAVHGGGSCQLALTTDMQPSTTTSWQVIMSIEGGCPSKDGNGPSTYDFTIPSSIAPGSYSFAWTWISKLAGQPEYYMNCAPVTITAGGSKRDVDGVGDEGVDGYHNSTLLSRDTFPELFVANLADINSCKTTPGTDPQFPNPGANVMKPGTSPKYADVSGTNCVPKGRTADAAPAAGNPGSASSGAASSAPATTQASSAAAGSSQVVASTAAPAATSQAAAGSGTASLGDSFITTSSGGAGGAVTATSAPATSVPASSAAGGGASSYYTSTIATDRGTPHPPVTVSPIVPSSAAASATSRPAASSAPAAGSSVASTLVTSQTSSSGVFVPASSAAASAPAASSAAYTSAPVASSSAYSAPAATSSSTPSAGNTTGGTSGSTGSASALHGACSTEGMFNCDGTNFQQCASGSWSVMQPLAAGTHCTVGQTMGLWRREARVGRLQRIKYIA